MRIICLLGLVGLGIACAAAPACASFSVELSLASPSYSMRVLDNLGVEDDRIYHAYGFNLHGRFIGPVTGLQIEGNYTYGPWDTSGQDLLISAYQLSLKYPRNRDAGQSEALYYYWLLRGCVDEITVGGAAAYSAKTGLLGFELYSSAQQSGSLAVGFGLGWRETTMPTYTVSGVAAAFWLDFSMQLSGALSLYLTSSTIWSQPAGAGHTLMERDTNYGAGLALSF